MIIAEIFILLGILVTGSLQTMTGEHYTEYDNQQGIKLFTSLKQEYIPVGCVPPASADHACFNSHHQMSLAEDQM